MELFAYYAKWIPTYSTTKRPLIQKQKSLLDSSRLNKRSLRILLNTTDGK